MYLLLASVLAPRRVGTLNVDEVNQFRLRHQAIIELGLLATREGSVQRLFDEAARLTRDGLDADAAKILERRPSGTLLVRSGVGWPPGIVGVEEIPPEGDSQANYALRIKAPVIVTDLPRERRFTPWPTFLEVGVQSGVNVVIESARGAYGVLEVDQFAVREFTEDDIDFLQSAANLLSVALDRQQYEQERDHLVDVTAHELRSPLTVVVGRSQRLVARLASDGAIPREELASGLEDIISESRRVQRLLRMLLELGRAERGVPVNVSAVDLTETMRAAAEYAQEMHRGVRIHIEEPEHQVLVPADEDLARIVLGNLIENAAKYSVRSPDVRVKISDSDGAAQIRIRDRCGGINGNELDRLFDRYFRGHTARDFRGFGLGLFVSHRAAEILNWRIDVQNSPGEGCEFVVTIGRQGAPASASGEH